jgi:hypothetical protein
VDDPRLAGFFSAFPMQAVDPASLDATLAQTRTPLAILFLWGRDCPNCDIAKRAMLADPAGLRWPGVAWLHGNVYADPELGTRFGLHGIPAFIVFRNGRKVGRITPWPGPAAFAAAIERQLALATH